MTDIFISADNIISPVATTTADNFERLTQNISGIQLHTGAAYSAQPFYSALFNEGSAFHSNSEQGRYTRFENLLVASIAYALTKSNISAADKRTVLIISTTKGNVSLMETEQVSSGLKKRISLNTSARLVAGHFGFVHAPVIVSNACISGILAILTGMRLIRSGQYDHAVIAGADIITRFVLSGFQSFQAISSLPCKPFDADRDGINLGEGAATMIITSNKEYSSGVKVAGGSVSNDANHISGPSRTGEELNLAIARTMNAAGLSAKDIDFISAHGTATIYNDEMEAKAINLANLQSVPVNSLKGYYGHTLGAAGLMESIISVQSLKENTMIPTRGYSKMGVTQPVNVCSSLYKNELTHCLKTASGFGGCNAAMIFSKE
ncbi:MAG TPA: beta-ketoacyl synthase N-terminal-like domain-containing protein [Ferruginibacter sp.]|nr:beta-ketoacyl synthase N-terminal-like domain-containing protein [Ferruginibacter sp.]